ncbi:MAG: DUF4085 family protein [Eubacteriales bacterium]
MKYMTKEWYETMQKTSFHLLLKVSKKAEVLSEDYFKRLYKSEEKACLKLQEDVSNVKFEDIYPDEFQADYADGRPLEPAEFEEAKKEYFRMREQACLSFANKPAFNTENEKKRFKQSFRYNIKHLERNLPNEILQKIADIRVLALNHASADIKKEITAYCKANEKAVESATKLYWNEYKKNFRSGELAFTENFSFHDCKVISCRKKGKDIVLILDNSGGFTAINQIILKNCMILKQYTPLHGAWWLYDKIYKTNDGYEIHILLQKNELVDFIVIVTDVEYLCD